MKTGVKANWPLITFISTGLFLSYCWNLSLNTPALQWWEFPQVERSYLGKKYEDLSFEKYRLSELTRAYATGQRRHLSRKVRDMHRDLGLIHLTTPSGLHLSILWRFFNPFLGLLTALTGLTFLPAITISISTFVIWNMDGLMAMQRMSLYRLLRFPLFFRMRLNRGIIFLITLALSLLLGNFSQSPLSFGLSALFFGLILASSHNFFKMAYSLICAQALVQSLMVQKFTFISSFLGVIITPIFVFIFPLSLIEYWVVGKLPFSLGIEYIIYLFLKLIKIAHTVGEFTPSAYWDTSFSLALAFLFLGQTKRVIYCGVILLLFSTQPVYNLPPRAYLSEVQVQKYTRYPLFFKPENIERTRRGYKTWTEQQVCYHRLLISQYERQCRQK